MFFLKSPERKLNSEMTNMLVIHAFITPSAAEFLKLVLLQCSRRALPNYITANSAAAQTYVMNAALYGALQGRSVRKGQLEMRNLSNRTTSHACVFTKQPDTGTPLVIKLRMDDPLIISSTNHSPNLRKELQFTTYCFNKCHIYWISYNGSLPKTMGTYRFNEYLLTILVGN